MGYVTGAELAEFAAGLVDVGLACVLVGICAATIGRTMIPADGVGLLAVTTTLVWVGDTTGTVGAELTTTGGGAGGAGVLLRVELAVAETTGVCFLAGAPGGRGTYPEDPLFAAIVVTCLGPAALTCTG